MGQHLIGGIGPDNKWRAAQVDADGKLVVTGVAGGGGGTGGTGDASAAKQDQQTALLTAINTDLGAPEDAPADSDTATGGLIALFKRSLQTLASISTKLGANPVTRGGGAVDANTQRVTLATDGPGVQALTSIDGIYAEIVDQPNATTTYICQAPVGTASSAAAWRVRRIVVSGTTTTTTWAGGSAFNQIADNRASLTYA